MSRKISWRTDITRVRKNKLTTYGVDQEKIIASFSYEEMVYLLLFGRKPTITEATMLRAVILSHCSHGITGQSTLAVRMGVDTGASLLNSVLGGLLVGSGAFHQGSLEVTMRGLQEAHASGDAKLYTERVLTDNKVLFGYGHRFHTYDPRARVLMDLCDQHLYVGPYVQTARAIDEVLLRRKGVRMNIEAAGGSILLDLGFPTEAAPLIILIGRVPMLAAAYLERLAEERASFQKVVVSDVLED